MLCPGDAAEEHPVPGVDVRRVETDDDVEDMAAVLAEAFQMPIDAVRRTLPLSMTQLPGIEVHVARRDGRALSTVASTRHDRLVGIWSMGTLPETQGQGIGKALLSQVMTEHRRRGAETFFLGATPAGLPLYQRLGYETIAEAQVWVRGETSQA
jgi:predicted N-acetyltransferase YhbS